MSIKYTNGVNSDLQLIICYNEVIVAGQRTYQTFCGCLCSLDYRYALAIKKKECFQWPLHRSIKRSKML